MNRWMGLNVLNIWLSDWTLIQGQNSGLNIEFSVRNRTLAD
jgi:hypothetical protein